MVAAACNIGITCTGSYEVVTLLGIMPQSWADGYNLYCTHLKFVSEHPMQDFSLRIQLLEQYGNV
jgi:hypothetical protein